MSNFYFVATPIGNLKDITLRALEVLKQVDLVFSENPKITKKLLVSYQINVPIKSLNDFNLEKRKILIRRLVNQSKNLAFLTGAGTPGISDPSAKLVNWLREEFKEKVKIIPIPGPSALTTAISIAPLPLNRFVFLGFLPKKKKRKEYLKFIACSALPVILFEAPHRIQKILQELKALKIEKVYLFRELTKIFEEFQIIDLKTLNKIPNFKGEIILIVPPQKKKLLE